jgi:hypothetical protein
MATLTATGLQFSLTDVINSKYWMYPAGVKKLFFQAAAPTGWTKDTTQNNKMLRVVSGTGGVSGGTIAFDSAFPSSAKSISVPFTATPPVTSGATVGGTTLASGQIPNHTHSSLQGLSGGAGANPFSNAGTFRVAGNTSTPGFIENSGVGGGSHNHPYSGNAPITTTGTTTLDLTVQYIDSIICTLG